MFSNFEMEFNFANQRNQKGFFQFFLTERERDHFVNQSGPLLFVYFGSVPPFAITNGYRIISQKCLIEHNLSFILSIALTTHVRHFPPSPPQKKKM